MNKLDGWSLMDGNNFLDARYAKVIVTHSRVYLIGTEGYSGYKYIHSCKIGRDGYLSDFILESTTLPFDVKLSSITESDGRVYIMNDRSKDIYSCEKLSDGVLGKFVKSSTKLPIKLSKSTLCVIDNYACVIGVPTKNDRYRNISAELDGHNKWYYDAVYTDNSNSIRHVVKDDQHIYVIKQPEEKLIEIAVIGSEQKPRSQVSDLTMNVNVDIRDSSVTIANGKLYILSLNKDGVVENLVSQDIDKLDTNDAWEYADVSMFSAMVHPIMFSVKDTMYIMDNIEQYMEPKIIVSKKLNNKEEEVVDNKTKDRSKEYIIEAKRIKAMDPKMGWLYKIITRGDIENHAYIVKDNVMYPEEEFLTISYNIDKRGEYIDNLISYLNTNVDLSQAIAVYSSTREDVDYILTEYMYNTNKQNKESKMSKSKEVITEISHSSNTGGHTLFRIVTDNGIYISNGTTMNRNDSSVLSFGTIVSNAYLYTGLVDTIEQYGMENNIEFIIDLGNNTNTNSNEQNTKQDSWAEMLSEGTTKHSLNVLKSTKELTMLNLDVLKDRVNKMYVTANDQGDKNYIINLNNFITDITTAVSSMLSDSLNINNIPTPYQNNIPQQRGFNGPVNPMDSYGYMDRQQIPDATYNTLVDKLNDMQTELESTEDVYARQKLLTDISNLQMQIAMTRQPSYPRGVSGFQPQPMHGMNSAGFQPQQQQPPFRDNHDMSSDSYRVNNNTKFNKGGE